MLVASKIPLSRIWHLNFAEIKTKTLVSQLKVISKREVVSFKVNTSERVLCLCSFRAVHSTRKQLARWRFFEGLQSYMEKKGK